MRSGSLRSGLTLVVGSLMVVACDAESPTAPATTEAVAPPSLAVSTSSTLSRPTLPTATVNTALVARTGKTITVAAGGNLQQAINSAVPGDEIVLKAGATYTGNFTLPKKSGSGWITIRSSASSQLPAGVRVSPSKASLMPKLVSPNNMAAIRTLAGAHHYRLVGLELTTKSTVTTASVLLRLGSGSPSQQSTESQAPSHIVVDRSYIHGRSNLELKNCVELHSAHTAVIDSHVAQCHARSLESHAIIGWNGPGPFLLENNYVEGAGINVMFGGSDPATSALMPEDITIRRNHVVKPLDWKGKWLVKNLVEFKIGRRVLIEANVLENSWVGGQTGFAFNLKTAVGSRADSWGRTEDVTVRHNVIRNVAAGAVMSPLTGGRGLPTRRIRFEHNVWDDVGESNGTKNGRIFQVQPGVHDVQIEHNTMVHSSTSARMFVTFGGGASNGFVFRDNLTTRGVYGVKGDGVAEGKPTLDRRAPGYVFSHNAIVGAKASIYPTLNSFPTSLSAVGFASLSGRDYRLSSSSPYRGKASDGTDIGADVRAVTALTAGVVR